MPLSHRVPRTRTLASWLAALLVTALPLYADAAEIVHIVAKGQTLGRIAKRYRTTVVAIREANGLRPGQQLHPGLSLVIPEKGKEGDAAKKGAQLAGLKKLERDKVEKGADGKRRGGAKAKRDEGDDKSEAAAWKGPRRPGWVRMIRGTDRIEAQLVTRRGRLSPGGLAGLGKILRFYPTGATIPIDPRLASLIGTVSDHFGGKPIHVVSGFRPYSPVQYTPHSNHNVGRAMDFSVEGVPNTVVRDYCRTFRNAGVGYYPNSSFVHLDVRAEKAYWIDYSRAGEAPRYDSAHAHAHADEAASDVEPHAGAAERPAGESDPGSGSNETP